MLELIAWINMKKTTYIKVIILSLLIYFWSIKNSLYLMIQQLEKNTLSDIENPC